MFLFSEACLLILAHLVWVFLELEVAFMAFPASTEPYFSLYRSTFGTTPFCYEPFPSMHRFNRAKD